MTWSASYSLVVMTALYNYYLYTGDLAFVRDHWPAVVRQMAWDAQQVDTQGLFGVTSSDADDWNLESPVGEVTYVNALYVQALNSAAKLAAALGQRGRAKTWSTAATSVASAVNRTLWDPATHVYDASNSLRGAIVQDANALAILSGIASPQRARSISTVLQRTLATLTDRSWQPRTRLATSATSPHTWAVSTCSPTLPPATNPPRSRSSARNGDS